MTSFRLRRAIPGDAEAIAHLLRDTMTKALPFLPVLHTADEDHAFIAGHVLPACTVWVVEMDRIVGFIACRDDWIEHLYVDVDCHGRGIGSALLGKVLEAGPRWQLWAFQKNEQGLRFYKRKGFRVVERTDGSGNEEKEPDARLLWLRKT